MKAKVTAIHEAKDLRSLPLDHLLSSIITHEMVIGEDQSKNKNCISFKASVESEEEFDGEECSYSLENLSDFSTKNFKWK